MGWTLPLVLLSSTSLSCVTRHNPDAVRSQDQYANYVIQKTLQLAPREAALSLVESIREHLSLMRNSSGGRRMLTKIAKRFPVSPRVLGLVVHSWVYFHSFTCSIAQLIRHAFNQPSMQ